MGEAVVVLEGGVVSVKGSGFTPDSRLQLSMVETATNGDKRSASYRPVVAHGFTPGENPDRCAVCGNREESHTHEEGVVDWDEPLAFGNGTATLTVRDGDQVVTEEVFHLG